MHILVGNLPSDETMFFYVSELVETWENTTESSIVIMIV